MRAIEARLRRLEDAMTARRVVVVQGADAEHDEKMAALDARGEASDRDLIIYVRRFSDPATMEGERA